MTLTLHAQLMLEVPDEEVDAAEPRIA